MSAHRELLTPDEHSSGRRRIGQRMPRWLVAVLAAWLGAVLFFGASVAPAAFAVLPTRTDAGALVGRTLPVLMLAGMVVGAILMLGAGRLRAAGAALRRATAIVGISMLASCGLAQLWVAPAIDRIRTAAGTIETRPPDDPLRRRFGRLHAMSVALLGIAWLGGTTLLLMATVTRRRRT